VTGLLDAIEELGIRDNTLFIFTADNGPEMIPEGSSTPSVEYIESRGRKSAPRP